MKRNGSKARTTIVGGLLLLSAFFLGLVGTLFLRVKPELTRPAKIDPPFQLTSPIDLASLPTATRFDFPLGSENGALVYNAQRFTENKHLGDDLNGIGGEDSDLGDPVYAVADGRVLLARDVGSGWGNIILLLHAYEEKGERKYIQSYYAHLETIQVNLGQNIHRGQQIGTVGTGNGNYFAHLHFEMREFTTPYIGSGYRADTRGWIDPSAFISQHRGAPDDDVGRSLP